MNTASTENTFRSLRFYLGKGMLYAAKGCAYSTGNRCERMAWLEHYHGFLTLLLFLSGREKYIFIYKHKNEKFFEIVQQFRSNTFRTKEFPNSCSHFQFTRFFYSSGR